MINPEIFKAYDIRGIYGTDFDNQAAYQIALAFVALRQNDPDWTTGKQLRIGVGRDMRISSPDLAKQLISGLLDAGADVFALGVIYTPGFDFAVADNSLDGGLMVSASHNPKEWNG